MALRAFPTQVAFTVPFENEPGRSNGFTSDNVQEAVEEALDLAVANDRFVIPLQYTGNANTGRYLEFFSGIDSEDASLFFDNSSQVLAITAATTGVSSNAELGFFDLAVSDVVPLYTLDMNGQKRKTDTGTPSSPLFSITANAELAVRVTSSSINKPHLIITFSSTI